LTFDTAVSAFRRIAICPLPEAALQARTHYIQETMTIRQMTPDQQALFLHFFETGLKWVAGHITFDDVVQRVGKPKNQSEQFDRIRYGYYLEDIMTIHFMYNKPKLVDGKPRIAYVKLKVGDYIRTSIPYERFDNMGLGLHRLVRGELIDGVRREHRDFFAPTGALEPSGFHGKNFVTFGYRLPMPHDSLFDVAAGSSYIVEWIDDDDAPVLSNIRKAENLRTLGVGRYYLDAEELEQRYQAARRKY
jgi:hypothetical protein